MDQPAVSDFMTLASTMIDSTSTLEEAAWAMAEQNVGALVVGTGPAVVGVVTDRDLVVRGLAVGLGLDATVQQVTGEQTITVGQADPVEVAFQVMRVAGVRRIPVLDGDEPVGILAFGDLGTEREASSVTADISNV